MTEEITSLDGLFEQINKVINKTNSKLCNAKCLLEKYSGNDWKKYEKYCDIKYARNIILQNENVEILLICWKKGQKSCIHDHPERGCLMKVLKGSLVEDVYVSENNNLKFVSSNILKTNNIGYKIGKTHVHAIFSPNEDTVSLHIYSPPKYCACIYK
jgi:cysteine dioxygenase